MQTFREIRESDCYYVDKTAYIGRLLDEGKHYFLSRPRRFGKSLFLDTCKELFEGNEPLFEGLAIHDRLATGRHAIRSLRLELRRRPLRGAGPSAHANVIGRSCRSASKMATGVTPRSP